MFSLFTKNDEDVSADLGSNATSVILVSLMLVSDSLPSDEVSSHVSGVLLTLILNRSIFGRYFKST